MQIGLNLVQNNKHDPLIFRHLRIIKQTPNSINRNRKGEITGVTLKSTIYITGAGASEQRARSLTSAAKSAFKPGYSNGVKISFDVHYKYRENVEEKDLKGNENLLTFFEGEGKTGIDPLTFQKTGKNGRFIGMDYFTGNTGRIYGKDRGSNYAVLHERLHFFGLSDRYYASGGVFKGFEDDIMGGYGSLNINDIHYEAFRRRALQLSPNNHQYSFLLPKTLRYINNRVIEGFKG
jgi:hypothetical protein